MKDKRLLAGAVGLLILSGGIAWWTLSLFRPKIVPRSTGDSDSPASFLAPLEPGTLRSPDDMKPIGQRTPPPNDISEIEKQLVDAYGRYSFVPESRNLTFGGATGLRASNEGLLEVTRLIQPGSEDEFIGILTAEDIIYPGRVISITPIARPDYEVPVQSLAGLKRNEYDVMVGAVTPVREVEIDGDKKEILLGKTRINAGDQDAQALAYEEFLQKLQAQSARLAGNGYSVFLVKAAHSEEEAYQAFKLNARYGQLKLGIDKRQEHRTGKKHLFLMYRQEYFQVRSAPVEHKSGHPVLSRLQATQENIDVLQKGAAWERTNAGIPFQNVPAEIRSVTYGRFIVAASEEAIAVDDDALGLDLEVKNPTAEAVTRYSEGVKRLAQSTTFKLVTWGGGNPKNTPDTKDKVDHQEMMRVFQAAVGKNNAWTPESPGRPIAFIAYYLDQGGTRAHSHTLSDKNLLSGRPGFPTDIRFEFHCGNDRDGTFAGDGEFSFEYSTSLDGDKNKIGLGGQGIDDGAGKPQWTSQVTLAGMDFQRPLTVTVKTTEEDGFLTGDNDIVNYPILFPESALKPVPSEFTEFSEGELRNACKSIDKAIEEYYELRKLGDIHKLTADEADERADAKFREAWDQSRAKAVSVKAAISKCREELKAVDTKWKAVIPKLEQHKLRGESAVIESSKIVVDLIPHASPIKKAVQAVLDNLNRSLDDVEKGL